MNDETEEKPDRFSEGYEVALVDVEQWVGDTIGDWTSLKIVNAEQEIWLRELAHAFALRFLYQRNESANE